MSNVLYYVYEKATGLFAGSGQTPYEDETYSSTTIPTPEFIVDVEMPFFVNGAWEIRIWPIVDPVDPGPEDPENPEEGQ